MRSLQLFRHPATIHHSLTACYRLWWTQWHYDTLGMLSTATHMGSPHATKFVLLSPTLQVLGWYIPDSDFPIVIRLDLDSLCRQSQYSRLHRIHVVTPRNT